MRRFVCFSFLLAATLCPLHAETPPCGIAVIRADGPKVDERFVAATPEQVKAAMLKALPAIAMKVHKDKGFQIEAKTDSGLLQSAEQKNKDAGVHGAMHGIAFGSMKINIQETTQDGVTGSRLRIEFDKPAVLGRAVNHGNDAVPLAEETACLVKTLSTNDPVANPRGLPLPDPAAAARAITIPEATPLKIQLRDMLDSKIIHKKGISVVQFEVVEDVVVDGAILVRRGALASGHFTDVEKAKGYGRNAEIDFAFDTVTAVDGQNISLAAAGEKTRGGRHNETAQVLLMSPALGWLAKGADAVVRAGTSYEVETSGEHTIQTGH